MRSGILCQFLPLFRVVKDGLLGWTGASSGACFDADGTTWDGDTVPRMYRD